MPTMLVGVLMLSLSQHHQMSGGHLLLLLLLLPTACDTEQILSKAACGLLDLHLPTTFAECLYRVTGAFVLVC